MAFRLVPFPEFASSTAKAATTTPATTTTATSSLAERMKATPQIVEFRTSGELIEAVSLVRSMVGASSREAHDVVRGLGLIR